MRNEEQLLSNYSFILELINTGFRIKQITQDINRCLGIKITERQLRYLIDRVRNNTIHKEYDNIVLISGLKDALDKNLGNYCVDFNGLLITYKSTAHLTNPEYIITSKNIMALYSQQALLYAKRILKLYHISDINILQQHKSIYPEQLGIDFKKVVDSININFSNEFAKMLIELKNKYVNFLTTNN